jgi:2-oxoglutarate dehydrogenase E2 component (dihydrolipoamide succinyltransferase)
MDRRFVVIVSLVGLVSSGCVARTAPPPPVQYADPADEELVEVPLSQPTTPPPAPAPVAPQPAPAVPQPAAQPAPAVPAAAATIKVLAVSVRPPQIAAGGQVQLVINYEVGGLAAGATLDLTEERQLVLGNAVITTLTDSVARTAGPYTSSKPVTVPATATKGLYTLRARVFAGSVTSAGTAVFQVQ